MIHLRVLAVIVSSATACASATPPVAATTAAGTPTNILLEPWAGPYGGVPPFDRVKPEDFRPAFDVAIARTRAEYAAIANAREPATFENTIAALEDAGRSFTRINEVYGLWSNLMSDAAFAAVEREMEPRLAAFWSELSADPQLFQRINAVRATVAHLTPVQRRLVEMYHDDFVRAGAELDAAGRRRIAEIDERLSMLFAEFSQHVRADEASCVVLGSEAELAGLPASLRASLATAAADCGHPGAWAVANTRSAVASFLTYSDRRDLRERVWRNYDARGNHGDANDNNQVIKEILALRRERARLLGFSTYAHSKLAATMARTPERALQVLETLWPPAVARVREEVAAMQAVADRAGEKLRIAPWDYHYYAEQVRKAMYDVDDAELRPYLQLDHLREAMFWVAGELFGLAFAPAPGVPVYHPDVEVFVVKDRATGRHVGLWYFDPYARPGKYNGGQTDVIRIQERFRGAVTTIMSGATPFVKPGAGEPALLGWRDATTLFHEFGHALHNLLSSVDYPSLAGGRVMDGYGEFPALLLEKWLTPELLRRFAVDRHGAAIPAALVDKLARAATFKQGFLTVDYLASALVELKLHLASDSSIDPAAFERATLAQLGAPEEVAPRFRLQHFTHVFASNGYAAGYYTYLWSDMHAADAFEAFTEAGGLYDPEVAARLRAHVLSVGNTVDPLEGYRAFRGHDATLDAVLRARGFAAPRDRPN